MADIQLLLVDADGPVCLGGLPLEEVPLTAPPVVESEELFSDDHDRDDLRRQRWGIVMAEGASDEPLRRLAPLLAARARASGCAPEDIRTYTVARGADPARWIHEHLRSTDAKRPRYLLMIGDLDELSLDLQFSLCDHGYYPGRLAFADPQGYSDYAEKVCRWEEQPRGSRARVRMVTARTDFDYDAPDRGYRELMKPAYEHTLAMQAEGDEDYQFTLEDPITGTPVELDEVLEIARATDIPTVLWTMSHGTGGDSLSAGSLLFNRKLMTTTHVADGPFLSGGIWFMFACYGAATPTTSLYWAWLTRLIEAKDPELRNYKPEDALRGLAKEKAFLSPLPLAALANPQGPLAVIGHADLAWIHSFKDLPGAGAEPKDRFLRLPRLLAGEGFQYRAGHAFARFRDLAVIDSSLARHVAQAEDASLRGAPTPAPTPEYGRLWMHRQDLASYILLGDPAVRLPLVP